MLWPTVSGLPWDRQHTVHSRTSIPPRHSHEPDCFWLGLIWSCSNWQVETAQSSEHSITMIDYISFSWRSWRQPVNDSGIRASSLADPGASVGHVPPGADCSVPENVHLSGRWSIFLQVGWQAGGRWLEPLWVHRVAAVGVAGMCLLCHIKSDTDDPWWEK